MPVCKVFSSTFNVFKEISYNFEYKKYVLKIALVPQEILVHVFTLIFCICSLCRRVLTD